MGHCGLDFILGSYFIRIDFPPVLKYRHIHRAFQKCRARIFELLRIPRIQGTNSARLCSLVGRYYNPTPTRFLAPIDFLKIAALVSSMMAE